MFKKVIKEIEANWDHYKSAGEQCAQYGGELANKAYYFFVSRDVKEI